MHSLEPYRAYKHSGVECLGDVPEHWDVRRLRYVSETRVSSVDKRMEEDEYPVHLCNYVDVYKNDRIRPGMTLMSATATAEEIRHFHLRPGDVLITKDSEAWTDVGVPAFVEGTGDNVLCGYHLALLRPSRKDMDGHYLFRALQSRAVGHQFHVRASGVTRYGLSHSAIKSVWLPLPPLSEQTAVVRFLDHLDGRIRRYIRAKQKMIALLEEQKQIIIHQAVTGQIDTRTGQPYPTYQLFGVEWLGKVPSHWEVMRLRRITRDRCDGPFGSGLKSSHYTEKGVRVVRLQNIGHGEFKDSDAAFISLEHYASLGDHSVVTGDLLIAGLGDNNHPAGRACVAPENIAPAMVKADCFRFRLNQTRAHSRFVALQLTATATVTSAHLSTGATRQRTNLQSASTRPVAIPAIREQNLVVEYVSGKTSEIRAAQDAVGREIELLNDLRTRLIVDVVTGKLDVREAAAALPEVDPPATDDDLDDMAEATEESALDYDDDVTGLRN